MNIRKKLLTASLKMAQKQQKLKNYVNIITGIVPDLSNNSSKIKNYDKYLSISSCDIDPIAISRLKEKDIKCYHTKAEDLFIKYNISENIYLSFEMVEHLHNPTEFFRQISINGGEFSYFIMSVPFRRFSLIGLKYIRRKKKNQKVDPAHVHIFELSPNDWKILASHSGLRMVFEDTYYQYPRKIPILSDLLKRLWRKVDFEGYYLAAFIKDNTYSDLYDGW